MKKFWLFYLFGIILLLFSGCFGQFYPVYSKPIPWNKPLYRWYNNKRVVGVFLDTKENEYKINQALREVLSAYVKREGNTLTSKKVFEPLSMKRATKICSFKVRFGFYGYYRNLYEKQQLINMCIDKYISSPHKRTVYSGYKLKVSNNCIDLIDTHNGIKYSANMCIRIKKIGEYIVVYIEGHPYNSLSVGEFIKLNNKLIEAFNKFGLKNIKKSVYL